MSYLVVDLDETLIKTDLLYEHSFALLKKNPFYFLKMIYWLASGGSLKLKNEIAKIIEPNAATLPYRQDVLDYIKTHKAQKHTIILASASPNSWVQKIASHLDIFDLAFGSEGTNLKGLNKYNHIKALTGTSTFTYIGDSNSDLQIWKRCGQAVAINGSPALLKRLRKDNILIAEFSEKKPKLKILIKQMRIHQWAKNTLLFLPMIAAHYLSVPNIISTSLAMIAFGFSASTVYIINDLIDLDSDRKHRTKRNRPLAAGAISIKDAILTFACCVAASISLAAFVGVPFLLMIAVYWSMNFLYTFYLKKEIVLDIVLLSGMYTSRIFAGAATTGILVSQWLLSFSTLFFFSLACVKRFTELAHNKQSTGIDGRGYRSVDQSSVLALGVGTGLLSIVVLLLYLQSPEVKILYTNESRLWLLTPLLLYWLGRIWILTCRGEVNDDPVVLLSKTELHGYVWLQF